METPYQDDASLTLPRLLLKQAETLGKSGIAIREKAYGVWHKFTWEDYLRYVRHSALGFTSLGVRRGENVVLVVNNHPEWLFSELGAQAVGAVTINLFTSSIPEELRTSIQRTQAVAVIAQDQEQVDKLLEIRERIPHVRKVVYIDPTGMRSYRNEAWLISFAEFLAEGMEEDRRLPDRFLQEIRKGNPKDIALMIQTSGTTGVSKLAMLSHRSMIAMGRQWTRAIDLKPDENWLSMSPPAWIVDQMWCLGVGLYSGMTMNFPETPETVTEDFREIGPAVIITASRFWEDLASKIRVKMADSGWLKRKLFHLSEQIGTAVISARDAGKSPALWQTMLHRLARIIIYRPLLDRIGCSHFRNAYTGGHPISPEVIRFFQAVGMNLKQCYGLTEAGGIFQVQPDGEVKPETVGKPLPGVQVMLDVDQEVLVKSDSLFSGYYRDYQNTEKSFHDGWLKTGDAGYLDQDGHLIIIGRREDIIKNKTGQAFSPDFIETRLKFSPYIKEAVVFGEARPYITAMINIDMENVGNWAEERLIPFTTYLDLSQQPAVEDLIRGEVKTINEQLPEIMKIKKFLLLYKLLDADDEELTRTGKVRRRFIYGIYLPLIEAMYRDVKQVETKGKIRYRDGRVGEITTNVKILTVATS
ncbi:MAG TPA: AMP-binding protein [Syntrophales bacterium]|jgi:long-chain acyl-CoA synthetase|nr:AMP-binding protein [Syntrophales bacterium]HON22290.1 AMP-binding protein [Syntrophales bacterium]HOU76666.1 AMP-binding protein [Syntrophales bacterium]HPC31423.1 AMP-binding protein [Syntrophales bacterium]HQG33329.1 AMP-binding protein [Syntrophales bacterium]